VRSGALQNEFDGEAEPEPVLCFGPAVDVPDELSGGEDGQAMRVREGGGECFG
jgi:hypothetical protein